MASSNRFSLEKTLANWFVTMVPTLARSGRRSMVAGERVESRSMIRRKVATAASTLPSAADSIACWYRLS